MEISLSINCNHCLVVLIATYIQRPALNIRLLQVHEEPFERFCRVIPRSVFLNAGVMCLRRFLLVAE